MCYTCANFFLLNDTSPPPLSTLSLHDALPILKFLIDLRDFRLDTRTNSETIQSPCGSHPHDVIVIELQVAHIRVRSEEHTSELQSPCKLVCRLLLEKKNWEQNQSSRDKETLRA